MDGRQPGHYTRFEVTSEWAVILPQLAKTCRMTCESVPMNGLAIWSPTESACGDKLTYIPFHRNRRRLLIRRRLLHVVDHHDVRVRLGALQFQAQLLL
jgi:hypothetical protein